MQALKSIVPGITDSSPKKRDRNDNQAPNEILSLSAMPNDKIQLVIHIYSVETDTLKAASLILINKSSQTSYKFSAISKSNQ